MYNIQAHVCMYNIQAHACRANLAAHLAWALDRRQGTWQAASGHGRRGRRDPERGRIMDPTSGRRRRMHILDYVSTDTISCMYKPPGPFA